MGVNGFVENMTKHFGVSSVQSVQLKLESFEQ